MARKVITVAESNYISYFVMGFIFNIYIFLVLEIIHDIFVDYYECNTQDLLKIEQLYFKICRHIYRDKLKPAIFFWDLDLHIFAKI